MSHTVVVFTANSNTGYSAINHIRNLFPNLKVRAVLRKPANEEELVDDFKDYENLEIIHGDIKKTNTLAPVFKDCKAAYFSTPASKDRAALGKMFVDACFAHGVEHAVIISVLGADTKTTVYHKQFNEIEEYALAKAGKPVTVAIGDRGKRLFKPTILRSAQFFQNFYGSLPGLKKNVLYMPLGEHDKLVHIDFEDVGKAIAHILANPDKHGNKVYNLIGERQFGTKLAAVIAMKAGQDCIFENVSDEIAALAYKALGLQEWIALGNIEMIKFVREGGAESLSDGDYKSITGESPSSFAQFVRENLKPMLN
eukprot:m.97115 g.97115  ORF g.97115 m.97115 type:complete len:311 (-) comp26947_c3_seq2:108-1040(-)